MKPPSEFGTAEDARAIMRDTDTFDMSAPYDVRELNVAAPPASSPLTRPSRSRWWRNDRPVGLFTSHEAEAVALALVKHLQSLGKWCGITPKALQRAVQQHSQLDRKGHAAGWRQLEEAGLMRSEIRGMGHFQCAVIFPTEQLIELLAPLRRR